MHLVPVQQLLGQVTAGIGQQSDGGKGRIPRLHLPLHVIHLLEAYPPHTRETVHHLGGTVGMDMKPKSSPVSPDHDGIPVPGQAADQPGARKPLPVENSLGTVAERGHFITVGMLVASGGSGGG